MQALPLRDTLVCHLLTAWLLKLPLWPSDLIRAVATGELPFLAFTSHCRDIVRTCKRLAPGLLESPDLTNAATLTAQAQSTAHAIGLALPELNLGAQQHLNAKGGGGVVMSRA
jgi:hypothetical protein